MFLWFNSKCKQNGELKAVDIKANNNDSAINSFHSTGVYSTHITFPYYDESLIRCGAGIKTKRTE